MSVLIARQQLVAAAASIVFQSIPQNYADLRLEFVGASSSAGGLDSLQVRLNGDAGANYDWVYNHGNNGAISSAGNNGDSSFRLSTLASAGAGVVSQMSARFGAYAGTVLHKTFMSTGTVGSTVFANGVTDTIGGQWRNAAAIASLTLYPNTGPNFIVGTVASLYADE